MASGQLQSTAQESTPPTLERQQSLQQDTRDTITDLETMLNKIEDFLRGPRPEKEQGGNVESCPSGILAQICQIGDSNLGRLQDVHRRLARLASDVGVGN